MRFRPTPRKRSPGRPRRLSTPARPLATMRPWNHPSSRPSASCICTCTAPSRLREGALAIETLAKLAKADAMPALAITDTNNLFGALEFSEKLAKSGVQPIVGVQATVDFGDAPPASSRLAEQRMARAPIVLLAQNEAGYRHLMRLVSSLWLDPKEGDEPHLPFDALVGCRGAHRADRRPRRADRPGARPAHGRPRREPPEAPRQSLRQAPLCRTPAPRARIRGRDRAGADRARRPDRPAARRDQRALFRRPLRLRGA